MKRLASVLAMCACLVSNEAAAWTAVSHSKSSGYTDVEYDADSPDEAEREALTACSKRNLECELVGRSVHGPIAMVVAKGTDGMVMSSNADVDVAVRDATRLCEKTYKRCRVVTAVWDGGRKWASAAMGTEDGLFIAYGAETKSAAEKRAMSKCEERTSKKGSCKVFQTSGDDVWFVYASNAEGSAGVGFSNEREKADGLAISACEERKTKDGGQSPCKVAEEFHNDGPTPEPAALKKVIAAIKKRELASAPAPRESEIQYSDTCSNAACVRKYRDGRSVRYTACLNPATLLPMNDPQKLGGCGGVDAGGNPFGMKM